MIASMRDLNGMIVFPSIISPRNLKRVKKNVFCLRLPSCFFFSSIWWYFSKTLIISCFACDCMKISSK